MKNASFAILLACFLPFALVGCGGGGAKSNTVQETRTTTTGQELMDLQKAHQQGVISDREFERQKKKILSAK
ncbi:SHOCT domain-containing protein [Rubellicoccus peritrichatus]|uniref:SHOCT domain-containing protein n=1 Tax=Rubellicoccus peritrichatus TaxID=3080537 RepID=A0AAQ3L671_9BACT|nr:SHOCT domain-containing protein [Puniceicoccus sp. CR14]WOO39462.1 SHOCT domain-containing protein [Puniceicoccus sp. CR14]